MLELRQVSKSFGAFSALNNVDFAVKTGEIVGLLGENGAGKSTLLNLVGGVFSPSRGEIYWRDEAVKMSSPRAASRLGIGVVHQHPQLVEAFTVAENFALAATSSTRSRRFSSRDWEKRADEWAQSLGWKIDTHQSVEKLSGGERQRVEILKALFAHGDTNSDVEKTAQLLLLDEPTANLTPQEADELFGVMRSLKAQGCGLVFVSHKLREVIEICDRVIVLRRGKVVGERVSSATNAAELAQLMIGETARTATSSTRSVGENAPFGLEIEKLNCGQLRDFSLQVRQGEIVGIAGVDGNGQTELIEILAGLRAHSGTVKSHGEIAIIPPDRERSGLIGDFSLTENVALHPQARQKFGRFARFDWRGAQTLTRDMMTRFDVRAPQSGERSLAKQLSGGNQQKVLIARALEFGCGVVVAADPTRGLDIGAANFIHQQLRNAAQNGAAVLLISTDLDEVLVLSNRVGVLYEGRLLPDENGLSPDARDEIGRLMGGEV